MNDEAKTIINDEAETIINEHEEADEASRNALLKADRHLRKHGHSVASIVLDYAQKMHGIPAPVEEKAEA